MHGMVDPLVTPLFGVAVAFTKILLRSTNNNLGADIIDDTAEPLAAISQLVLGKKSSKKQLERAINRDLDTRMRNMNERCHREGIDPNRLANPCAEVEAVLNTIDDHKWILEQAVHDPEALRTYFQKHALKQRAQVDARLVPYFDELIEAVAEQYINYAERSPNYLHVAAKRSLKNDKESREADAKILDAVDDVRHMVGKFASSDSKPSRIFFGSRPDVVPEDRFIERGEQEQLNALISDPTQRRTVLVGMRGCGKTQLAAALTKQCEDANWSLVAWINAVSRESIQNDLVELAKQLGIGTSGQPTQDQVIRSFLSRVKSAGPADRLIVFDNVEDIDHLTGLIPSGDGVRVVATTTNKVGWEDQGWNSIKVGVFDRETSIAYLLKVTKSDDRDVADALAERLGCLPLAIAQAAATAHNEHWTLQSYFKRLEEYDLARVIHPVRGDSYTQGLASALGLAVDTAIKHLVRGTPGTARRQLGALAVLAESGIPTRWLDPLTDPRNEAELLEADRDVANDAHLTLAELIDRSLVQQSADGSMTMLHRLQAQALRESWNKLEYTQACESAINILATVNVENFPRDHGKARRIETLNLIEQISALGQQEHSHQLLKFEDVWLCINQTFEQTLELGLSDRAGSLARTVDVLTDFLPPEHRYPIMCQSYLAGIFEQAGQLPRALAYQNKAVFDSKLFLGPDDKFTLLQLRLLADIRASAGDYQYAIDQYRALLKHPVIKRNNIERVSILNNLGHAYHSKRQFKQALPYFKKALQITEKIRGEEDRQTLKARNNLAATYLYVGMSEKAISHLLALRDDCEHILGPDDILTLTVRKGIAHAYASEIDLAEGVVRYESLLNDCTDTFDPEHPFTVEVREELEAARRDLAKEKDASHTEEHGSEG